MSSPLMLYHYNYPTSQVVPSYYSDQYLALPAVDQYSKPVFNGITNPNKGGVIMYGLMTTPGKIDGFSTFLHWVLSLLPVIVFCIVVYLLFLAYEWWDDHYTDDTAAFFKDGLDYYFQTIISLLTPGLLALTTMGWDFVEYIPTLRHRKTTGQAQKMRKFMDKSEFVFSHDNLRSTKRVQVAKTLLKLEAEGTRVLQWVEENKGADTRLRILSKRMKGKCPPLREMSSREPDDKVAKSVNKGKEVHIRLRKLDNTNELEPFSTLLKRLLHELAHCAMPNANNQHDEEFWEVLKKLEMSI